MVKPWADGPFKLISPPQEPNIEGISEPILRVTREMVFVHNLLIRALNAIYLQAPHVSKPEDIADFLLYCQFFVHDLHTHHGLEETYFFPDIEKAIGVPGAMEGNIAQHHAFEGGVEKFKKYVHEVKVEDFSGQKIMELIDDFSTTLVPHLTEEIATLLELQKYDVAKVDEAWRSLEKRILELIDDKHKVLPFSLTAHDNTFEGGRWVGWPSFPFFVPYMVSWIYYRKYRGAWRFSPCTVYGIPRPLQFLPDQ